MYLLVVGISQFYYNKNKTKVTKIHKTENIRKKNRKISTKQKRQIHLFHFNDSHKNNSSSSSTITYAIIDILKEVVAVPTTLFFILLVLQC